MKWIARVEQSQRRCDATTKAGAQCQNTGRYGHGDERLCFAHHPNWQGWYDTAGSLTLVAQKAVDEAVASKEESDAE